MRQTRVSISFPGLVSLQYKSFCDYHRPEMRCWGRTKNSFWASALHWTWSVSIWVCSGCVFDVREALTVNKWNFFFSFFWRQNYPPQTHLNLLIFKFERMKTEFWVSVARAAGCFQLLCCVVYSVMRFRVLPHLPRPSTHVSNTLLFWPV